MGPNHAVMPWPQPGHASVLLWSGNTCTLNACRFQDQLIRRMQQGEFDQHGEVIFEPCDLATALERTVPADQNFIINQVMRGGKNPRRFGFRGRSYIPSLSEEDPYLQKVKRMRTLFSSAQRLRGETKQINESLPQLRHLDNPLAIQELLRLDIEQQILEADPTDLPVNKVSSASCMHVALLFHTQMPSIAHQWQAGCRLLGCTFRA